MKKPEIYRKFIDCMVEVCNEGQGQIGARRMLRGEWNANAREDFLEDQYAANVLLARLNDSERVVLARLLSAEFRAGVFETLKYRGHGRNRPKRAHEDLLFAGRDYGASRGFYFTYFSF